jgi:putative PIN family toxin of toxin-antitoxin system
VRVVFDANVWVSAFATPGRCRTVVEACVAEHEVATSLQILEETQRALVSKFRLSAEKADEAVAFVRSNTWPVVPSSLDPASCRDTDDVGILGTAVAFAADYLVTGDADMLVLRQVGTTRIVTPADFARILADGDPEAPTSQRSAR